MKRTRKAFTLIELLIVIAIISILAALIIVNLTTARKRARDTQRKSDISQIQTAVEMYADEVGGYPVKSNCNSNTCELFQKSGSLSGYLTKDVDDPFYQTNSNSYYYTYEGTENTYSICAVKMEIDKNANNGGSGYCISQL